LAGEWLEPPGTHWIGGWLGPRASIDAVMKKEDPFPANAGN